MTMSGRVIDNRDWLRAQVPVTCPECGADVRVENVESRSYASGPADMAFMTRRGIMGEGWVTWRSLDWYCSGDSEHYVGGPIAYGASL